MQISFWLICISRLSTSDFLKLILSKLVNNFYEFVLFNKLNVLAVDSACNPLFRWYSPIFIYLNCFKFANFPYTPLTGILFFLDMIVRKTLVLYSTQCFGLNISIPSTRVGERGNTGGWASVLNQTYFLRSSGDEDFHKDSMVRYGSSA